MVEQQPVKPPAQTKPEDKADMGALWNDPNADRLETGSFSLDSPKKPAALARTAPGFLSTEYLVPSAAKGVH
jgi:hypothetical protein